MGLRLNVAPRTAWIWFLSFYIGEIGKVGITDELFFYTHYPLHVNSTLEEEVGKLQAIYMKFGWQIPNSCNSGPGGIQFEFEGGVKSAWFEQLDVTEANITTPGVTWQFDETRDPRRLGIHWSCTTNTDCSLNGLRFSYTTDGDFEVTEFWDAGLDKVVMNEYWLEYEIPEGLEIKGMRAQLSHSERWVDREHHETECIWVGFLDPSFILGPRRSN